MRLFFKIKQNTKLSKICQLLRFMCCFVISSGDGPQGWASVLPLCHNTQAKLSPLTHYVSPCWLTRMCHHISIPRYNSWNWNSNPDSLAPETTTTQPLTIKLSTTMPNSILPFIDILQSIDKTPPLIPFRDEACFGQHFFCLCVAYQANAVYNPPSL